MEEAAETGDMEEALKQKIRTTSVTYKMKDDAKRMLSLMGMPVIEVYYITFLKKRKQNFIFKQYI